jgi:endonuclease-3
VESQAQKAARTAKIIALLKKRYPDARLALDWSNPLELLIALILAAQCRDDLVTEVTKDLFKKYRTAKDWASAVPKELESDIRRISFFRQKTRSIQGACRMLIEKFGGMPPNNLDDLLLLPGVGRKTANVLLGNSFGQPVIGVDRHVARVSGRLGLTSNTDPDLIEGDLMPIVAAKDRVKFTHLLQFHGRQICIARKPKCPECPVNSLCPYPDKTPPE